jgi:Photosynthetic reaction centre cytochrome C subunit
MRPYRLMSSLVLMTAVGVAGATLARGHEPQAPGQRPGAQAAQTGQAGQQAGQAGQAGQQAGQGRGPAPAPKNLQVLQKDMTMQQVSTLMRTFTAALGVECSHCHVEGTQNRASDDKPQKAVARKMLQMVTAINEQLLKDVGTPPVAGAQKVTCYTCHRGMLKPMTAPGM